jgi:hypothetical protein
MNNTTQIQHSHNQSNWPACVGVEEASRILGWPTYFFPVLVRTGHLKPLGKPAQNSRKWFARVDIERLASDLAWLDKTVRLAEKHVRDLNLKHSRSKESPNAVTVDNASAPNAAE